MTTQVMTRKEMILLLALERMIQCAYLEDWDVKDGVDVALEDAQEAVRIARLDQ
jgi:hypothetical protein